MALRATTTKTLGSRVSRSATSRVAGPAALTLPPLAFDIVGQICWRDPDRVAHANVDELAESTEKIDGGCTHVKPSRELADGE